MRRVELYLSPDEVAVMLSLHVKTVLAMLRRGELGSGIVNLGKADRPRYRVPLKDVYAYMDLRRVFHEIGNPNRKPPELGVRACSKHELRRKVRGLEQAA